MTRPDPLVTALNRPEPELPECHLCGNRRGPWLPDPSGARWPSGAQMLFCSRGCPTDHPTEDTAAKDSPAGAESTLSSDVRAKRTIIVPGPHGPLIVFEPDWCTRHGQDETDFRAFTHLGDEFHITVDTPRGPMTLLTGQLFQQVWAGAGLGNDVMCGLDLDGGPVNCDPEQLRAIYHSAVDQLRQLLDLADQLDVLRGGAR